MDMWEAIAIAAIMLGGVAMVLIIAVIDAKAPRNHQDNPDNWPKTSSSTTTWTYSRKPVETPKETPKNDD